jgi:predicted permease
VVVQVAVGLLLIVSAGLLGRTYHNLKSIDPRVSLDKVLLVSIDPEANGYDQARSLHVINSILDRVRESTGVQSAALAFMVPFGEAGFSMGPVSSQPDKPPVRADMNLVSAGYFDTAGIRLLRGRDFRPTDVEGTDRVAIVNQSLARRFWPEQEPIGKTIRFGDSKDTWQVVGIAQDIRYRSPRDNNALFVYLPVNQSYFGNTTIHVRSSNPLAMVDSVRQAVHAIDPHLPVFDVRTLRGQFERSLWTDRLILTLLGIFGVVAAVVATLGLYAVMSFHVARQTREIGIRIALGASATEVVRSSLRRGVILTAAGGVLGLGLSLAATKALASYLYGVTPTDPATLVIAAVLLVGTASIASVVPARRATRVDPVVALRQE